MKTLLVASIALATVVASPAFAAACKHRAHGEMDSNAKGIYTPYVARNSDVVTLGGRVVGEDPDVGIRTQLLHDPAASEY